MRVLALLFNKNYWAVTLILTISLQSTVDAKNSQARQAKTAKLPDATGYKVRISSKYNGQGI